MKVLNKTDIKFITSIARDYIDSYTNSDGIVMVEGDCFEEIILNEISICKSLLCKCAEPVINFDHDEKDFLIDMAHAYIDPCLNSQGVISLEDDPDPAGALNTIKRCRKIINSFADTTTNSYPLM